MTVTSTTNRATLAGNGVAVNIPTGFIFFDSDTLVVTSVVDSTGVEAVQALGTDYTVSGGIGEEGTVTMTTAPASGTTIVVEREEPFLQEDAFAFSGKLPADVIESRYDKIVMMIQQVVDQSAFFLNASQTAFNALSKKISGLAPGTAGTDAVNKNQLDAVVAAAGNVPTPDNPGNDNYFLRANAGTFDWGAPSPLAGVDTITDSNKTMVAADAGRLQLFDTGAPNRTYSLLAAATAGVGFTAHVRKSTADAGNVVIDPDGSETIDGFLSFELIHNGDTVTLVSDGSNWVVLAANLRPVVTEFTSAGVHSKVNGRKRYVIEGVAAGGGGGGSDDTAASQASTAGGGSAGESGVVTITDADHGAAETVTVGAGGTGGTGSATPTNGTAGGNVSFGTHLVLNGGGAGLALSTNAAFSTTNPVAGGSGGTGDTLRSGDSSPATFVVEGEPASVGDGASSPFGAGGRAQSNAAGTDGGLGAGGAGGTSRNSGSGQDGGDGGGGFIRVTAYHR